MTAKLIDSRNRTKQNIKAENQAGDAAEKRFPNEGNEGNDANRYGFLEGAMWAYETGFSKAYIKMGLKKKRGRPS